MERNLEQDLHIGNDLEEEWVNQASLYMYYSEAWSDAVLFRDEAKQKVEIIHAELDEYYRKNWERFSESKITEASVESYIIRDERHKKAVAIFNKANHNVNSLSSAKSAFEHRKMALGNLVSLLISGFHSEPKSKIKRRDYVKLHDNMKKSLSSNPRLRKRKKNRS